MSDWENLPSSQWEDLPGVEDPEAAAANALAGGGEVLRHAVVGGTLGAGAKLAGRVADVLPGGADWKPGAPRKADVWGEAAGSIGAPQTPQGQEAERQIGRGMSAVGRAATDALDLDNPASQSLLSASGELLQDLPFLGGLARVPGALERLGTAGIPHAYEYDPLRFDHPDLAEATAQATAPPPAAPGPLTAADFAPKKPKITPKAGESAQAAAARQGIGPPAAPEVPGAPPGFAEAAAAYQAQGAASNKVRRAFSGAGTPTAGTDAPEAPTAPAAPPAPRPTPTPPPEAAPAPSAAPNHRGAPAPDVHHPDFFDAPDNQDLKSGPVGPDEQAARLAAVERGAPTLPAVRDSAITNDYATQGRDWTGKQAGHPVATAQIAAEGQALHSEANRISAETGGQQGTGESASTIRGRAYQDWHDTTVDTLNGHIRAAYAAEDAAAKQIASPGSNLKGVLTDDSLIDNANAGSVRSSVVALGRKMGVDLTDPNATMNAYQLENLRKHANSVYGSAPRFAQAVKNAVDADLPAGAYVRARRLQKIKSDMFDNRDGINQLGPSKDIDPETGRPRPENRKVQTPDVMKKIEAMDPGQVEHIVNTMKRSSSVLNALGDSKGAAAVADKALKAAQAVQSHFTERWIEEAEKGGGWNTRRANQYLRANQETLARVLSPEQMHQIRNVNSAANVLDMDKRYKGAFAQFTTGAGFLRERFGRAAEGLLSDLVPPGMNTVGELTGISQALRDKLGGAGIAKAPKDFTRPLGQRAPKQGGWIGFHGTRHEFAPEEGAPYGKFDPSKIGTGEGAQVYGHGLYLADELGVANTYKTAGTHIADRVIDSRTGKPFDRANDRIANTVADLMSSRLGKGDPGSPTRLSWVEKQIKGFYQDRGLNQADTLRALDLARHAKYNDGNVYHVHIPDAHVAKMLDWDKPLAKQPHVLEALKGLRSEKNPYLRNLGLGGPAITGMTGEQLYKSLADIKGGGTGRWDEMIPSTRNAIAAISGKDAPRPSPQAASEHLRQLGIPGVRYLDQGSRLAGTGTRNMVLFDPSIARIVGKAGEKPLGAVIGGGSQRGAVGNLNFRHFSNLTEPKVTLDPNKYGTGIKGAEAQRVANGAPKSISVYAEDHPDRMVEGGLRGKAEYRVSVPASRMYDLSADPKGFLDKHGDFSKVEKAIKAAGYAGYHLPEAEGAFKGQGRIFEPTPATRVDQRPLGATLYGGKQRGAVGVLNRNDERPATLNIGLHVGDPANGGRVMKPAEALARIKQLGGEVGRTSVVQSDTEPTLVADLKKPFDKRTLGGLSKALGQDAIAQRHSDGTGILAGPKAADWGGTYNPDYFRMHRGETATEYASRQTVDNAQAQHYPGIYDAPHDIMRRVDPSAEDPTMHQLFGVHRKDLHDAAVGRGDVAPDSIPGVVTGPRAKGAAAAKSVTTDANASRLRGIISAFKDAHPDAYHGMVGWYEMQPLHDKIVSILKDPQLASKTFDKLNTMMGMASPGSDVETEINRGTAAHMLAEQGRFDKFQRYGGDPTSKGATKNAPELANVRGHPYHSTAQAGPMRRYVDTGVGAQAPKTSMYIRASDAPDRPGSQYQNKVLVGDSHFSRGVGLADTRTSADPHGSISGPELADIHPWYHEHVAKPLGLSSTSAQAAQWGALASDTGVETAVGAPKLELFSQAVAKAAKRAGVTPEVMLERIIRGTAHAG